MSKIENEKVEDRELNYQDTQMIKNWVCWLMLKMECRSKVALTFDTTWWQVGRRKPAIGHWEGTPMKEGSEWVIGEWQAFGMVRRWISFLNTLVEGVRYKQHWKHSYFGYVMAKEYQVRGVIHYHLIIDNWFPWKQASEWWWQKCGSCKIEKVADAEQDLYYALKYCLKSGHRPEIWLPNRRWVGGTVQIIDLNQRYQEYMREPFNPPSEIPSAEQLSQLEKWKMETLKNLPGLITGSKKELSEGRCEGQQIKLDLQTDLDNSVTGSNSP